MNRRAFFSVVALAVAPKPVQPQKYVDLPLRVGADGRNRVWYEPITTFNGRTVLGYHSPLDRMHVWDR